MERAMQQPHLAIRCDQRDRLSLHPDRPDRIALLAQPLQRERQGRGRPRRRQPQRTRPHAIRHHRGRTGHTGDAALQFVPDDLHRRAVAGRGDHASMGRNPRRRRPVHPRIAQPQIIAIFGHRHGRQDRHGHSHHPANQARDHVFLSIASASPARYRALTIATCLTNGNAISDNPASRNVTAR